MSKAKKNSKAVAASIRVRRPVTAIVSYDRVLSGMVELLESARHAAARTVNAVMTATYWEMGRRIVECEQSGQNRAGYGEQLIAHLSKDLTKRFGRGFGVVNLSLMRKFYLLWTHPVIFQTPSEKSVSAIFHTLSEKSGEPVDSRIFQTMCGKSSANIRRTLSGKSALAPIGQAPSDLSALSAIAQRFPLPWSHYVRLLSVANVDARQFYETESLRCGWSVRQLDRQIATLFYERTLLSRNKAAMLRKGQKPLPRDVVTPEQEIKDPFVLEFLDLKDEYSESDLEDSLISKLEHFLLELGGDFTFIARQRRLRIGDEWYKIDLLFFHRRLRCLVVIDLKVDKFTHADAGQMHLYLNYARLHWTHPGENPPVGLILCAQKDAAVAKYALEGLPNKVLAAEYKLALPNPDALADELARTRKLLEARMPANAAQKPSNRSRK
jgi:predicted nuclease of restriction endonuclease-like (RecB) superfamily